MLEVFHAESSDSQKVVRILAQSPMSETKQYLGLIF